MRIFVVALFMSFIGNLGIRAEANPFSKFEMEEMKRKGSWNIMIEEIFIGGHFSYERTFRFRRVKYIIEEVGVDVNIQNFNGSTALIHASYWGLIETAKLLLEHNADPNIRNMYGSTALHIVLKTEHKKKLNIKSIINPHYHQDQSDKFNVTLLEDGKSFIQTELYEEYCQYHIQPAWNKDHIETIKELIKAGANVNIQDNLGQTPLMIAEKLGKIEIIDLLKEAEQRNNVKNKPFTRKRKNRINLKMF